MLSLWLCAGLSGASAKDCAGAWQHYIEDHQPLVFAALYSIPETSGSFSEAAGFESLASHDPAYLKHVLTPAEIHRVRLQSEEIICAMDARARRLLKRRLDHWIASYEQFSLVSRRYSEEAAIDAAFRVPESRDLFLPAINARGWQASEVMPGQLGGTLASAERSEIVYRFLNGLSAASLGEQARYWAAFFAVLATPAGDQREIPAAPQE